MHFALPLLKVSQFRYLEGNVQIMAPAPSKEDFGAGR